MLHTHEFVLTIDGAPLAAQVDAALESLVVDQHVGLPAACTLRFHDPTLKAVDAGGLRLGAACAVSLAEGSKTTKLFTGEIAGLEIERSEAGGTFTTVRAFDVLHRLQRGRATKTYQNVTYGDVVRTVLSGKGVPAGKIDSGGGVHPHLSQVDESDWQLLRRFADDLGFVLVAVDGKVDFGPSVTPSGKDVVADLKENVLRIEVAVVDDEAVSEVEVRGWDGARKQEVVAAVAPSAALSAISGPTLQRPRPAPKLVRSSARYATSAHAKAAARGLAGAVADARGEVHALLRGDGAAAPGRTLVLQSFGTTYDGSYTISRARHEFRPDEGYRVEVVAGSQRDRTLLGTIGGGVRRAGIEGVWPGIVTAVKDPDNQGRVRVRFPWVDDRYESFWAKVVHPGAGSGGRGVAWLPEINDEVVVAFASGELERPYVLGGVYNAKDRFDTAGRFDAAGSVNRRTLRSRSGHELDLVDTKGKESLTLRSGDGQFELTYDAATKQLRIACKGAGGVKIDSTGPLDLQGQQVKIASKTTMDLQASGPLTVKGAVIKLN